MIFDIGIGQFGCFHCVLLIVQTRFKHTVNDFTRLYSEIIFCVAHFELLHGLREQFGGVARFICRIGKLFGWLDDVRCGWGLCDWQWRRN